MQERDAPGVTYFKVFLKHPLTTERTRMQHKVAMMVTNNSLPFSKKISHFVYSITTLLNLNLTSSWKSFISFIKSVVKSHFPVYSLWLVMPYPFSLLPFHSSGFHFPSIFFTYLGHLFPLIHLVQSDQICLTTTSLVLLLSWQRSYSSAPLLLRSNSVWGTEGGPFYLSCLISHCSETISFTMWGTGSPYIPCLGLFSLLL